MLIHIDIRDFAIVDQLDLDLEPGLTVLTGETGTGKSILVEALGLVLGDRADTSVVRHGSKRAEINAVFDLDHNLAATQWLREHQLEDDGECQLRRTISSDGKSKGFINGRPLPLQMLRELGNLLIDIHGQHEHQSLLRKDIQRKLLDEFADHEHLLKGVFTACHAWKSLKQEYEDLRASTLANDNQLDLLRYQTQELQALNVTVSEINRLEDDQRRLANADKLLETSNHALEMLDENEQSVDAVLSRIINDMQQLLQTDRQLSPVIDLIQTSSIQIREAATELRHHLGHLDLDPQLLESIEQRLGDIHDLARKHRVQPDELPELYERLKQRLAELEGAEECLKKLHNEIEAAAGCYLDAANKLSASRKTAAVKLAKQVTSNMKKLGMPGSGFSIGFEDNPEDAYSVYGKDRIEFLVSTNPNQPKVQLNKIVSGGELSRISLAIQVITAHQADIPTLIFDEVDVGIGGRVAEIVGQKLRALGNSHQILCVTHLPQVATLGHHHLQVSKSSSPKTTHTLIQHLSGDARSEEIARMLGGIEITAQTRAHAKEMIERAQQQGT